MVWGIPASGFSSCELVTARLSAALMVAPWNIGKPVSTLVRVSGKGQATKSLCWDLSRSSSMVAVVAPLQLPQVPPRPQPPPQLPPSTVAGPDSAGPAASGHKQAPAAPTPTLRKSKPPQPVSQQGAAGIPNEGKRLLEEDEVERQEDGRKPKVAKTVVDTKRTQQSLSSPTNSQPASEETVQQLQLKCRILQQQNEDLQRRLGQILSMLKDKPKLACLLRRPVVK